MGTVSEPRAKTLSAADVHEDISAVTVAVERRRSERRVYNILERPHIRAMLDTLIASGACVNEGEAIERALKTFVTAVVR
jgi:hypothetical protein